MSLLGFEIVLDRCVLRQSQLEELVLSDAWLRAATGFWSIGTAVYNCANRQEPSGKSVGTCNQSMRSSHIYVERGLTGHSIDVIQASEAGC